MLISFHIVLSVFFYLLSEVSFAWEAGNIYLHILVQKEVWEAREMAQQSRALAALSQHPHESPQPSRTLVPGELMLPFGLH